MNTNEEFSKLGVYLSDADLHLHSESLRAMLSETELTADGFVRQCILATCILYSLNPQVLDGELHKSLIVSLSGLYAMKDRLNVLTASTERSRREVELLIKTISKGLANER